MTLVSNETFEAALNNVDYIKISKASANRYRDKLNKSELYNCRLMGLYNALRTYKPKIKMTSWIHIHTLWSCWKYCKSITYPESQLNIDIKHDERPRFDAYQYCLPPELEIVIQQRYESNMTFREIGKTNGYSSQTARDRLNKAEELIKEQELC